MALKNHTKIKKKTLKIASESILTKKIQKAKVSKQVAVFTRSSHKSQIWIKEIQKELKWMSGDNIYHLLRAVLQSLRDQLSVHESAHFAAQLPLLLRGTFYEGWNPKTNLGPSVSKNNFLELIKQKMNPIGIPNFELEKGVLAALNVIKKHISAGEMKDLVGSLNPTLKVIIEKAGQQHEALA